MRLLAMVVFAVSVSGAAEPVPLPPTGVIITRHGAPRVDSARILLTGAAAAGGTLTLHFTPERGETRVIEAPVQAAAKAATVARLLAKALTSALGADYTIAQTDPATIAVTFGAKRVPFLLVVAGSLPSGLSVEIR